MLKRLSRAAGSLSMLWSLVVLGAPAPFSNCAMPSAASPGMHMAMAHHGSMPSHDAGQQPSGPKHDGSSHTNCCSPACCCGSFAPLAQVSTTTIALVALVSPPQPVVAEQTIPGRAPHSLPFAHAPPLS